jgi:hypothetical protein
MPTTDTYCARVRRSLASDANGDVEPFRSCTARLSLESIYGSAQPSASLPGLEVEAASR